MKEIKAYIRPVLAHKVIEALKREGVTNISIAHVKGLGLLEDPASVQYNTEFIEQSSVVLKLEIICDAPDAAHYVQVIQENAHTGKAGDGAIFVTNVETATEIRTGEEGVR